MQETFIAMIQTPCGFTAMVLQIYMTFVGMPRQIRLLHRTKSSEAFSFDLFVPGFLAPISWAFNAKIEIPNTFLLITAIPAAILGGIVLGQIIYYRRYPRGMPAVVRAS